MEYLTIGNIKIKKTAALAPMAGVADTAYRTAAKRFGAAYVVGEMVSIKGLAYSDRKSAELLTITDAERPAAVQLFGCEPEFVPAAVEIAERYKPDIIDFNAGCPVPKVAGNGSGSALMKEPKLFGEMVAAIVKAAHVPVTVKIRAGWDAEHINACETAHIAEECGAAAVAVHGRTRTQMYTGKADREIIARVKQTVRIPVTLDERLGVMREQIELLVRCKGEFTGMKEARAQAAFYLKGMTGAARYRGMCGRLSDLKGLYDLIDLIKAENGE